VDCRLPQLERFLEDVLVRDAAKRPNIHEVNRRFHKLFGSLIKDAGTQA
jgi:hypothetical protein